jgi:hypothetical protein
MLQPTGPRSWVTRHAAAHHSNLIFRLAEVATAAGAVPSKNGASSPGCSPAVEKRTNRSRRVASPHRLKMGSTAPSGVGPVVAGVEQRQGRRWRGEPGTAAARGGGDGCGAGMRGQIAEAGGGGGAKLADGRGAVPRGWQRGRFREARGGSRGTGLERTGAWVKAQVVNRKSDSGATTISFHFFSCRIRGGGVERQWQRGKEILYKHKKHLNMKRQLIHSSYTFRLHKYNI